MAPKNGYVPDSALVEFKTTGMRLERATHDALMRADAASGGILWLAPPGGGYRTFQNQYDMKHGIPSFAYWNLNPNSKAGLANPGYSSHGLGICADIISAPGHSGANDWMLAHGADYGFSRPFGANDPNHWMFAHPSWAGAPALTPQERLVAAAGAKRRSAPSSQSAEAGAFLPGGTVGNFTGWIHGENVSGNDVWFQGTSGNWFWSGGFTDTGTHDLTDLNPPPVAQRTVLSASDVRQRSLPTTLGADSGHDLAKGTAVTILAYTDGVAPGAGLTDVWFQTAPTLWAWSGGFTDPSTTGLTKVPAPEGTFPTTPPPPPYEVKSLYMDISHTQAGIDFTSQIAAGVDGFIVKSGGQNAGPLYTSDDYATLLDRVDKVTPAPSVGHYWDTGSTGTPTDGADYFVGHLHKFDVHGDVLMLDNEAYADNASGKLWGPDEVREFFLRVIALTGIPGHRLWLYMRAADWKNANEAAWIQLVNDLGLTVVYAAWGSAPYATGVVPTPSSKPEPPAGLTVDVHQFTSSATVGNVSPADVMASPLWTVEELFAPGTVSEPTAWLPGTEPTPPEDSGSTPPVVTPPVTPPSAVPSLGAVIGMIAAFFVTLAALFLGH